MYLNRNYTETDRNKILLTYYYFLLVTISFIFLTFIVLEKRNIKNFLIKKEKSFNKKKWIIDNKIE
jgi:hypothetical protein